MQNIESAYVVKQLSPYYNLKENVQKESKINPYNLEILRRYLACKKAK